MYQSPLHQHTLAHDGFTLMEILVGIAIFLLLTGTAAFFVATFLASTDLNETSAQIAQTLRLAREQSMAGLNNKQYGVYFDNTNRRYILYRGASYNTRTAADAVFDVVTNIANSLTIATTFSGDVNFSRLGDATISGRITLIHSVGGNRTIDVNQFGIISQGGSGASGGASPILIITNPANPFSRYYGEILLTEGMNAFIMKDITDPNMNDAFLAPYDVIIVGEMALTNEQTTMLNTWVTNGGNLIIMRPNLSANAPLAALLGLTTTGTTLSDAYLLVNTAANSPGAGIVGETIQFHGVADRYTADAGVTTVALLYTNATSATSPPNPAVTLRSVGTQGGEVAAFTYDLARSVVYTRQGNPAWAGQDRNSDGLIRPTDLFYVNPIGALDWVDFNKIQIPQADEQQRLLANLILRMNEDKKPLPRFWYFPRGGKAVLVMTGDDHAGGGTAGRFDQYIGQSTPGCNVANWECIRSTSYIYPNSPLPNNDGTSNDAESYIAQGFEIGLHPNNGFANFTPSSLAATFTNDLAAFHTSYPSIPASEPVTVRTHYGPWSDYDTHPQVTLSKGIRFDTNYYFWPNPWVNDRPGLFTGSGMPMRFTKMSGDIIDVYQAPTQMQDQPEALPVQSYPFTSDTLFSNAIGPLGYYGFFVSIAHTDSAVSAVSEQVIASARSRNIPIISSAQALHWIDGRNSSSFNTVSWSGTTLSFNAAVDAKANDMNAMVPYNFGINSVAEIRRNGIPLSSLPAVETIKGITYQMFPISSGSYTVGYADLPPKRFNGKPSGGLSYSTTQVTLSLSTSENATCRYAPFNGLNAVAGITYDDMPNTFTTTGGTVHVEPNKSVVPNQSYTFYVQCIDTTGNKNTDDFTISFSISGDPFLVAYWRMEEGSGSYVFDTSGNGNTGTVDPARWVPGIVNGLNALEFDAVVTFPSSGTLNLSGPMTFVTWARFGVLSGGTFGRYLIGQCVSQALGQFGMTIGREANSADDNTGQLNVGWGGTPIIFSTLNAITQTNVPYFVGFTRSGVPGNWTARIYINGVQNSIQQNISTDPGQQMPLALGRCGNFNTLYFNGVLDEVRLYNRDLNATEIWNLYNG